MPELVSTAIGLGLSFYPIVQSTQRRFSAVSREAVEVHQTIRAVADLVEESEALFGAKKHVLSELVEVFNESKEIAAEDEDVDPVSEATFTIAADVIRALPEGLALPEIASEDDGSISLDWMPSKSRILSLSINENSRLVGAWFNNGARGRVIAPFDGGQFPEEVSSLIRIIAGNDTHLRAA